MPDGISIPGGPVFIGFPQPPDVPCDPSGNGWRGPPGPCWAARAIGPSGMDGGALSGLVNVLGAWRQRRWRTDDTAEIQSRAECLRWQSHSVHPEHRPAIYDQNSLAIPSNTDMILAGRLLLKPGSILAGGGAGLVNLSNVSKRHYPRQRDNRR